MESKTSQTRRERRIAARKQQILDAAVVVFAEKGFQRATTRDIAEAADVAEGTIYNYFDSKDHLLVEILAQLGSFEERRTLLEAALQANLRSFFRTYVVERMQAIAANYPMLLATLPEILNNPHLREHYYQDFVQPGIELLEQHAQTRIQQGEIRAVDAPLTTRLFISLTLGMQVLLVLGDPVLRAAWDQPDQLAQAMETLLFDGLEPD